MHRRRARAHVRCRIVQRGHALRIWRCVDGEAGNLQRVPVLGTWRLRDGEPRNRAVHARRARCCQPSLDPLDHMLRGGAPKARAPRLRHRVRVFDGARAFGVPFPALPSLLPWLPWTRVFRGEHPSEVSTCSLVSWTVHSGPWSLRPCMILPCAKVWTLALPPAHRAAIMVPRRRCRAAVRLDRIRARVTKGLLDRDLRPFVSEDAVMSRLTAFDRTLLL